MEVWFSPAVGFDAGKGTAQIYGSGANKIGWISLNDVAQFAVASLDNPAARNTIIELGGSEVLSPLEVVQYFEEAGGGSSKWCTSQRRRSTHSAPRPPIRCSRPSLP